MEACVCTTWNRKLLRRYMRIAHDVDCSMLKVSDGCRAKMMQKFLVFQYTIRYKKDTFFIGSYTRKESCESSCDIFEPIRDKLYDASRVMFSN